MRTDVYSKPAPVTSALCAALENVVATAARPPQPQPSFPQAIAADSTADPEPSRSFDRTFRQVPTAGESKPILSAPGSAEATGSRSAEDDPQHSLVPQNGSVAAAQASAGSVVCRVCLGILQSLDGPLQPVTEELLPQLSERDGGGAPWAPVSHGNVSSIANHVGYVCQVPTDWVLPPHIHDLGYGQ